MSNYEQNIVDNWIIKIQQVGAVNKFNRAFDGYIGKKVEVKGKIGTYLAKHIEVPLHYILLDGEDKPTIFHIFEIFLNYEIQGGNNEQQ